MFHSEERGAHKEISAEIYADFIEPVHQRRSLFTGAGVTDTGLINPADDYISRAICSKAEGRPPTGMEIVNICVTSSRADRKRPYRAAGRQ